jgi:hypothetical protein
MNKGFSINGWVFLLASLSLFAGFYLLGGIRGRNEVRSLSPELQAAQHDLKQAQLQYQFMSALKDSVIVQMKFMVDNSLAQVEQYKGICKEAMDREAAVRLELEVLEINANLEGFECNKKCYKDGNYSEETLELNPDTLVQVDCSIR